MFKHFKKSMSAILAACLISASVAVSAPAKAEAARVPSHDHQVTQSSFDYIGQVGNIDSETVSKIARLRKARLIISGRSVISTQKR